jgi:phosphate transport system substrate-binding protein
MNNEYRSKPLTLHSTFRFMAAPLPCRLFIVTGLLWTCSLSTTLGYAQTAERLSQVRKVYVDSLGQSKGAAEVRSHLVRRLQKTHGIQIVDKQNEADAIAKGTGQIWETGSISLSPRSHSSTQSTLEGFLSIELIGRNNQTLWSYLVTPSKFPWGGIADDLARQLATRLSGDIAEKGEPSEQSQPDAKSARAALKGAGATFPEPLYKKWFESFEEEHPDVRIGYDAVGSGEGLRRLKSGGIDFGASEMPLSEDEMEKSHQHFVQVPMVLGAVVPIYNLQNLRANINFTGEILAGIYLGKIRKWNDAQIREANPGVTLPDAEIVVVHRSDGSGTSFVWSDYLSKISPEWKTSVGVGVSLRWPTGVGAAYNDGVAAMVQEKPNSIGYVEFIYALQHELRFAAVKNGAGQFVKAGIRSVRAASESAAQPDRGFSTSITDAPGKSAYPIATYTWLLLPEKTGDKNKRTALLDLVHWMLSAGQKSCSALGYAPLPDNVAQRALQSVN